jgi:hypothetical protein
MRYVSGPTSALTNVDDTSTPVVLLDERHQTMSRARVGQLH